MSEPQAPPLYQLQLHKSRILIPKTISLIILSALFYFGIIINLSLLSLDSDLEGTVKFASVGVILLLILMGVVLNLGKVKHGAKFFPDHLEIGHKKIKYLQIQTMEKKQNTLDKIFKTYYIKFDKKHEIDAIPISVDIQNYLGQLINYAKQQQMQTQTGQYRRY